MTQHLNLAPGIHTDVSEKDYHADALCDVPTLSCSLAKVLINESPLHAWCAHPRLGNKRHKEPTAEMEFGSAAHSLCLGKGADIAVCDKDNWMTKDAKEFRIAARERGAIPILTHKFEQAKAQQTALFEQLATFHLLEQFVAAQPEVCLIFDDGPIRCRALLDKLLIDEDRKKAMIFDLKTTDSANPAGLGRLIFNQHYEMQEYSYRNALEKLRPDLAGRIEFLFLFLETEYPYCLTPVRLSGEQRMHGTSKWTRAWQMWDASTKANSWPAYTKEIVTTEAPGYALAAEFGKNPILP